MNFYTLILETLNEKGKSIKDLENDNILGKNTFYIFSKTAPSLVTIIKIANYLNISIDYMLDLVDINNFQKYSLDQSAFYDNLETYRKNAKISQSKLAKDLNISRTNFSRWANGTMINIYNLIELSKYFNCNIDDLLNHIN